MPLIFIMFLCAAAGLLLVGLAVPLIRRRVKPNALYGLRVPSTLTDEWVWYEANARSGRDLLMIGLIQTAIALLLPFVPGVTEEIYGLVCVSFLVLGALWSCILGWRRANRLFEERRG